MEKAHTTFVKNPLNPRVTLMFKLASEGLSNRDIALELGNSNSTVGNAFWKALKKLEVAGFITSQDRGMQEGKHRTSVARGYIALAEHGLIPPIDINKATFIKGYTRTSHKH